MSLLHGCLPAEAWKQPNPEQIAKMKAISAEYNRLENMLARLYNRPLPYPEEPEESCRERLRF